MKSSTKILIGVVVVALVGAGVYFGNTGLQKGSIYFVPKDLSLVKCTSEDQLLYETSGGGKYSDFKEVYNEIKNEKLPCSYFFRVADNAAFSAGADFSCTKVATDNSNGNYAVKCNVYNSDSSETKYLGITYNNNKPLGYVNFSGNNGNGAGYVVSIKSGLNFVSITKKAK